MLSPCSVMFAAINLLSKRIVHLFMHNAEGSKLVLQKYAQTALNV